MMKTGGTGDCRKRLPTSTAPKLLEVFAVTGETDGITLEGYVGKPSVLKSNRGWQTCINQRIVHNPLMFKAIDKPITPCCPKSGYPRAMLHLRVDPAAIDVNVHPAKTEIKFSDEQAVYWAIYRSIVTALVEQESRKTWPRRLNRRQKKRRWQRRAFRNFTLPRPIRPRPQEPLRRCRQHLCLRLRHCLRSTRALPQPKGIPAGRTESGCFQPFLFTSRPASASLRQERTYEHRFVRATAAASFSEALAQHGQVGALWMHPLRCQMKKHPKSSLKAMTTSSFPRRRR